MKCFICKEKKNLEFVSKYKLEIESDQKYFKNPDIYRCKICDFGFAYPMPEENDLNFFYKNIYRLEGRPPFWRQDIKQIESTLINDKNLNYLLYITTFIKFKDITTILDFGSGYGDLAFLLKKKFPHLKLYSCEDDKYCKTILQKRGYQNFENLNMINQKFDLIISIHSLEHLTDVSIFPKFKDLLTTKGSIFFEVPNCVEEYFNERAYDSPHLLFYTKKSFEKLSEVNGFQVINFTESSYTFNEDQKFQKESQTEYYKRIDNKLSFIKLKISIKKLFPKFLIDFLKKIIRFFFKEKKKVIINSFYNNSGDNCYIRGLIKKNN